MSEKYTPAFIAQTLRSAGAGVYDPTPEQQEIISILSNPLEPSVVIAGAGSGKTETMAARVIYLVANEIVAPDQILGLTFTRKAASELSHRIRLRLRQLRSAGLIPPSISLNVNVGTYHSYASQLLSEHGLRLGVDTDGSPLGDASLWQLANRIVREFPSDDFTSTSQLSTVIDDVLGLSTLMLEHQVSIDQIRSHDERILQKLQEIDLASSRSNDEVRKSALVLRQRIDILPIVEALNKARLESEELSFDDQMALAAQVAQEFDDVVAAERERYKVVLLDEYQDTSQSQVRMLSSLFGDGHPVMAVGDPYQAIYGWRGASAGTINSFNRAFPKAPGQTGAKEFNLLTTFRNDVKILDLANKVSSSIVMGAQTSVKALAPRNGAGAGHVAIGAYESVADEARAIAGYIKPFWDDPARKIEKPKVPSTFAVLVRKRSQIPAIDAALREAGMETQIVGSSGLIYLPEVADLFTMMKALVNPDAGTALMRHLTGPRLNIGPRDLAALGEFATKLSREISLKTKSDIASLVAGDADIAEADDRFSGSLADALDEITKADKSKFSQVGYERLLKFSADLRRLRSRAGGSITDFIHEIEDYLNLEPQVMLRDGTTSARKNIDRFIEEAANFTRSGGSILDFIEWLDVTSKHEGGLKTGSVEVRTDVVQIMTVHTAKGAEWDVVAIPGLAEGQFPSTYRVGENWLSTESHIPFDLRGDSSELPPFSFGSASDNTSAKKEIEKFFAACKSDARMEELRLAYVAITRAKTHLFCSTPWWRDGTTPASPSEIFLSAYEFAQASGGEILNFDEQPQRGDPKPEHLAVEEMSWPIDHLGAKRPTFDLAVAQVDAAPVHDLSPDSTFTDPTLIEDAAALIAELAALRSPSLEIALPPRLSTSTLMKLHENAEDLAINIRRPMPRSQDEYSRRGTAFHGWIEKHFKASTIFDDEDLDFFDPLESDMKLDELKEKWLASDWAGRDPYAVEKGFEAMIGGTLIRGRIDAIYKTDTGFEVVDWKTGSTILGPSSAIQLAVYRLAFARMEGVDISNVSAAFHYVPTNHTDRRADLMDEAQLVALLQQFKVIK